MKIGEMQDYREPEIPGRAGLNVGDRVIGKGSLGEIEVILAHIDVEKYAAINMDGGNRRRDPISSTKRDNTPFTCKEMQGLLGHAWRNWEVVDE